MFFKFLIYQHTTEIAKVTYGTAGQLRSSLINMGPNKAYIIDLPRAKGKSDSSTELLNVLEDLKNGFVISPFYGKDNKLFMDPPHVIICANYIMDYELLSEDRWEIYELKNKEIKNITEKILNKKERIANKEK